MYWSYCRTLRKGSSQGSSSEATCIMKQAVDSLDARAQEDKMTAGLQEDKVTVTWQEDKMVSGLQVDMTVAALRCYGV